MLFDERSWRLRADTMKFIVPGLKFPSRSIR